MSNETGEWIGLISISAKSYTCGYCGNNISSEKAFRTRIAQHNTATRGLIYICHTCNKPTYFTLHGVQTPGSLLGGSIDHLPEDIEQLYREIRNATTTNSYTAAVLAGRKLLMHIAVQSGAEEGESFVTYVNYLNDNGYTPPNSQQWVDEIRQIGNEANHEIVIMTEYKAQSIIKFLEMLMKFNYEFPGEVSAPDEAQEETPAQGQQD
jgi:hypothetical protein